MEFRGYLEKAVSKIVREVWDILEAELNRAKKTDKNLVPLLKAFIASCQGGKGIRGMLVMLGYEIGNSILNTQYSKFRKEIIKIGAAYEIFHSSVLVHDDIIDQSPKRRGKDSLYKALGDNHYGISQAISLGDWGFFLAFRIISESKFPDLNKIAALEFFSKVMMDTAWGELLDLEKTDHKIVMKLKTALYSITGPLVLGSALAGADRRLLGRLGIFGESLGIAYQIKDDMLDGEIKGEALVARKQAEEYKNKAMRIIPRITGDERISKILEQMGEYLVQRTK